MKSIRVWRESLFSSIFLLSMLFPCIRVLAQNEFIPTYSADAWFFARQILSPVSLYTGQVEVSVPLYVIETGGLKIPISIVCDTRGMRMSKQSGIVGLNWNLQCGGAVIRIVNGSVDEVVSPAGVNGSMVRKHLPVTNSLLEQNFGLFFEDRGRTDELVVPLSHRTTASGVDEYAPDLFVFNALGHSGTFFVANDGTIKVRSSKNYRVQCERLEDFYFGRITITADDGTVLIFGSDSVPGAIDFSSMDGSLSGKNPTQANSWRLSKVISPKGDMVAFNYGGYYENHISRFYDSQSFNVSLRKISFNEGTVEFKSNYMVYGGAADEVLNEIQVKNSNNEPVRNIQLFNNVKYNYLILDSLSIDGQSYKFDYYKLDKLPQQKPVGGDLWGFWNGIYHNGTVNEWKFNMEYNECPQVNEKMGLNFDYTLAGTLRQISYPNGGYEAFGYEQNTYNYYFQNRALLQERPDYTYEPIPCGGLRIREHLICDEKNRLQMQRYKYKDTYTIGEMDYNPANMSSITNNFNGILHRLPAYDNLYGFILYNSIDDEAGNQVTYPTVFTVRDDSSYTSTTFSSSKTYYDRFTGTFRIDPLFKPYENELISKAYKRTSYEFLRGKPTLVLHYNKKNELVAKDEYSYDFDISMSTEYVTAMAWPSPKVSYMSLVMQLYRLIYPSVTNANDMVSKLLINTNRIYYHTPFLKKQTHTEYLPGGTILTAKEYSYDALRNLSYEKTTDSKNVVKEIYYRYVEDLLKNAIGGTGDAYYNALLEMKRRNMVGIPLEQEIRVNGRTVISSITQFRLSDNVPMLDSRWNFNSSIGVNNYQPLKIHNNFLVKDSRMVRQLQIDHYDKKRNVLQMTDRGGQTTSFLWDYMGSKVLAVARNVSYTMLDSAAGTVPNTAEESTLVNFLSRLHTNLKAPLAQLTSYIHRPLVGITQSVTPAGVAFHYSYDSLERLEEVRDGKGKIISHYAYKYASKQPLKSDLLLNPTPGSIDVLSGEGALKISVNSDVEWNATSNVAWINVNPSSGTGNMEVSIICQPNSGADREGVITFFGTDVGSKTVMVRQKSAYFLSVDPGVVHNGYMGGTIDITVNSLKKWNIASQEGNFYLAERIDDKTLRVLCYHNPTGKVRAGKIKIVNGYNSFTVDVVQLN